MPEELTWDNAEAVGVLLSQTHPELTPLSVPLAELQKYVTALPGFKGDPAPPANKLAAIQKVWHTEFQDRTKD